jgi:hypothetical protein
MTPDGYDTLVEWLGDGPFGGIVEYQEPTGTAHTVRGLIRGLASDGSAKPFTHVQVDGPDRHVTIIHIDNVVGVFAALDTQPVMPAPAPVEVSIPSTSSGLLSDDERNLVKVTIEATRREVFEKVNTILDAYDDTDDDGDNLAECAPEDRWRLYRDLYLLTGRTHPDAEGEA